MKTRLHFVLLTAVLFILATAAITPLTFFTTDTGLRLVQIQALQQQAGLSFAIPYPTQLDPNLQHVPYYYAYALLDGELFLNISPFFPLLAAWLALPFGTFGLTILPVLGGVLAAYAVYRLATIAELPFALWLGWLTVFATPLLLYSIQLWDHSLATGLGMIGIAFLANGIHEAANGNKSVRSQNLSTLAGGASLALAFGQRPELYPLTIAAGLATLIVGWPRWQTAVFTALGGLLGALPIWGLQWLWVGHPLGMAFAPHLLGYGVPETYPVEPVSQANTTALRIGRFLLHIEARDPATFIAALLIVVSLVLFAFSLRLPAYRRPALLGTAAIMTLIATSLWAQLGWANNVSGLLSTLPLIPLAFAIVSDAKASHHPLYRFITFTTLFYLILMLALWPALGGDQWGQRYLLTLYPLLLFMAAYAYHYFEPQLQGRMRQLLQIGTLALVVASLLFQLVGVRRLFVIQAEQIAVRNSVATLPADLILTDQAIMPSFLASLSDKQFLYVGESADLPSLLERTYAQGITNVAVLTQPDAPLSLPEKTDTLTIVPLSPNVYQLQEESDHE